MQLKNQTPRSAAGTASRFWTEARVAILKRRRAEHWTARAIAELLGCTRNAVLGKANRLDLPQTLARDGRPVTTGAGLALASGQRELVSSQGEPPSRRLALIDVPEGACRWIAGDDGCCCGHPTARGSPYCSFHNARAYRADLRSAAQLQEAARPIVQGRSRAARNRKLAQERVRAAEPAIPRLGYAELTRRGAAAVLSMQRPKERGCVRSTASRKRRGTRCQKQA